MLYEVITQHNQNLERLPSGSGQPEGLGGLLQGKPMGDQIGGPNQAAGNQVESRAGIVRAAGIGAPQVNLVEIEKVRFDFQDLSRRTGGKKEHGAAGRAGAQAFGHGPGGSGTDNDPVDHAAPGQLGNLFGQIAATDIDCSVGA